MNKSTHIEQFPRTVFRCATRSDLERVAEIYNQGIDLPYGSWRESYVTPDYIEYWLGTKKKGKAIFIVSVSNDSCVTGFATCDLFKPDPGYENTAELSIYVDIDYRGTGAASGLMRELLHHLRQLDMHTVIAAIDSDNHASLEFHRKHQFVQVGALPEVGKKHGVLRNLVLLQRLLND